MNWAEPSAASSDWAAKEKETKFKMLPVTKKKVPMYQMFGFFTFFVNSLAELSLDATLSSSSPFPIDFLSCSTDFSRRVWPCFIKFVPPLIQTDPNKLRQIPGGLREIRLVRRKLKAKIGRQIHSPITQAPIFNCPRAFGTGKRISPIFFGQTTGRATGVCNLFQIMLRPQVQGVSNIYKGNHISSFQQETISSNEKHDNSHGLFPLKINNSHSHSPPQSTLSPIVCIVILHVQRRGPRSTRLWRPREPSLPPQLCRWLLGETERPPQDSKE